MNSNHYEGKKQIYRTRDGAIFGVCKGLAKYLDLPVFWVRVITVVAFIMTGFWPVGVLYLAGAAFMKPEPILPFESEDDQEFYHSYVSSRAMALRRLKRTFDSLDRRIRRMEDIVTQRDYDWESRLHE